MYFILLIQHAGGPCYLSFCSITACLIVLCCVFYCSITTCLMSMPMFFNIAILLLLVFSDLRHSLKCSDLDHWYVSMLPSTLYCCMFSAVKVQHLIQRTVQCCTSERVHFRYKLQPSSSSISNPLN